MKKTPAIITRIQHKGFSLIELLITVAIAGIFTGLSIVTLSRNQNNEKLKAATFIAATWLEDARKIAIQNDTPCKININNETGTLEISKDEEIPKLDNCELIESSSLEIRKSIQNSESISLCSKTLSTAEEESPIDTALVCNQVTTGTTSWVFTPRGTATDSTLIKLTMPTANHERCLAVLAPTGQIRLGKTREKNRDFTTAY